MAPKSPNVGFLVTCLVDLFRPSVGFAAIDLLEQAGCQVTVAKAQTCCGQPGYNSGDRQAAQAIARRVITEFEGFDYVVAPSGSCAGMVRVHYPRLFAGVEGWADRAHALAAKTFELVGFLVDVMEMKTPAQNGIEARITYHDSCAGLREMGVKSQARNLLSALSGVQTKALGDAEICCGFGGTFCVKYPDISDRMVSNKVAEITATGADMVLAGDMGCLLNIAGKLSRQGSRVEVRHIAEILSSQPLAPAIGQIGQDQTGQQR